METVVINLEQAATRMAFQSQQLNKLGIEFIRLSANCPSHKLAYEKYQYNGERRLSFSEVSLFLNHKKIWDMVIEKGNPILILEDDAYLSDDAPTILNQAQHLKNVDYLNLEARGTRQRKLVAKLAEYQLGGTNIFRLFQGRSGSAGYILWPRGARKLLSQFSTGKIDIVDKFINANYLLEAYQAEPAILTQLDMCQHYSLPTQIDTESSIKPAIKVNIMSALFWMYKLRRIRGQLKVGLNHLTHLTQAEKRPIALSKNFR